MSQDRRRPQSELEVEPKTAEPKDATQERKLKLVSLSEVRASHLAEVMRFLRTNGFDFSLEVGDDDETMPRTLH